MCSDFHDVMLFSVFLIRSPLHLPEALISSLSVLLCQQRRCHLHSSLIPNALQSNFLHGAADYLGTRKSRLLFIFLLLKQWHCPLFCKRNTVCGAHAKGHWNKMVGGTWVFKEKGVKKGLSLLLQDMNYGSFLHFICL